MMFSDMAMLLILILGSVSALVDDNSTSVAYQDDNKLVASGVGGERRRHGGDHHFDLLIFTQHWPYTTCLDWEEKRHGSCSKIGDLCLKTKKAKKKLKSSL